MQKYYEHTCLCGCDKQIEVKEHHKWYGIPKYIIYHNKKHGESSTKLYYIWHNIKNRCLNPNTPYYKYYGGRGITICPEWTDDYTKFRDWSLSNGYQEGLEIDREDTDGNYEPSNCRWVTHKENMRNTRHCKLTLNQSNEIRNLHKTEDYTYKELAHKFGVDETTIFLIINNKRWVE